MRLKINWRKASVVLLGSVTFAFIQLPASLRTAENYDPRLVELFVAGQLDWTGRSGWADWHELLNFPHIVWMEYRDVKTNRVYRVFTGDKVVAQFTDRSTVRLRHAGLDVPEGRFFEVMPGTARRADGTRYSSRRCGSGTKKCASTTAHSLGYITSTSIPIYTASWRWGTAAQQPW